MGRLLQDWLDRQQFPPSQRRLAERIGCDVGTLRGWMSGSLAGPAWLERLAEVTGIAYDDLLAATVADQGYAVPEQWRRRRRGA